MEHIWNDIGLLVEKCVGLRGTLLGFKSCYSALEFSGSAHWKYLLSSQRACGGKREGLRGAVQSAWSRATMQ